MSARALEFVENWVSDQIKDLDAANSDEGQAKALAGLCVQAAVAEGIPEAEINEVFDDLAAFISGQIAEAAERAAHRASDDDEPED